MRAQFTTWFIDQWRRRCLRLRRPQVAALQMESACCSIKGRRHWRFGAVGRPPSMLCAARWNKMFMEGRSKVENRKSNAGLAPAELLSLYVHRWALDRLHV